MGGGGLLDVLPIRHNLNLEGFARWLGEKLGPVKFWVQGLRTLVRIYLLSWLETYNGALGAIGASELVANVAADQALNASKLEAQGTTKIILRTL